MIDIYRKRPARGCESGAGVLCLILIEGDGDWCWSCEVMDLLVTGSARRWKWNDSKLHWDKRGLEILQKKN